MRRREFVHQKSTTHIAHIISYHILHHRNYSITPLLTSCDCGCGCDCCCGCGCGCCCGTTHDDDDGVRNEFSIIDYSTSNHPSFCFSYVLLPATDPPPPPTFSAFACFGSNQRTLPPIRVEAGCGSSSFFFFFFSSFTFQLLKDYSTQGPPTTVFQ